MSISRRSKPRGPLLLGSFFDTVFLLIGRKLLHLCLFSFFASADASSAYLTASEVFPLETRALAIAIFYAAGTAIGRRPCSTSFWYSTFDPFSLALSWRVPTGCDIDDWRRYR